MAASTPLQQAPQQIGPFTQSNDIVAPAKDIFHAATVGDLNLLRELVEDQRIDVNSRSPDDQVSPLHWACLKNRYDCVKYLLDNGAELDCASEKESHTPLMWACIEGHMRVVYYLLEQGANPHRVDIRGYNALHHAIQYNRSIIAHFLLGKGMFVDGRDNEGHTPLMWAAYMDHEESARYLLSQGSDINLKDNSGCTALHWSALKGKLNTAKALLEEENVDIWAVDNDSERASQMAERKGFKHLAKLFKDEESKRPPNTIVTRSKQQIEERVKRLTILWFCVGFFGFMLAFALLTKTPMFLMGLALVFAMFYGLKTALTPYWLDANNRNPLFVGVVAASYSLSVIAYFNQVIYMTSFYVIETIVFLMMNIIFVPLYIKLLFSNPGSLEKSKDEWRMFVTTLERDEPLPSFCLTCMVRRPIRSKHCRSCHQCVARFDHHCAWINNCVGVNNQFPFFCCLLLVISNHVFFVRFLSIAFGSLEDAPGILPVNVSVPFYFTAEPTLFLLLIFHLVNFFWQIMLLFNLSKGIKDNITTNEAMNGFRYEYMRDSATGKVKNPFDKGIVENIKDIVSPTIDWYHLYHLPGAKSSSMSM